MNSLPDSRCLRTISAALLTAAVLLPYSGPGVCSMLGRMGHGMEMMADAADVTVSAPGSGAMCCSMTGCGVTHAGPVALAMLELPDVPMRESSRTVTPQRPPWTSPPPLPPPPQS